MATKNKKNKYNRRVTYVDDIRFDSVKESERYKVLRDAQKRGEIESLELQKRFILIPTQKNPFKTLKYAEYRADFVYVKDGKTIVEDVKGYRKGVPYSLFMLKKKLMYKEYGLWVEEI